MPKQGQTEEQIVAALTLAKLMRHGARGWMLRDHAGFHPVRVRKQYWQRVGSSLRLRKGKRFAEEFHHVVLESIGYVAGVGSRIDFE